MRLGRFLGLPEPGESPRLFQVPWAGKNAPCLHPARVPEQDELASTMQRMRHVRYGRCFEQHGMEPTIWLLCFFGWGDVRFSWITIGFLFQWRPMAGPVEAWTGAKQK